MARAEGAGGPVSDAPTWHVVRTHPHREQAAVGNIRRLGFEAFLPQLRRVVRHARRRTEVLRPLFPQYAFVRLRLKGDRWRPILSTAGVSAMIMDGERPRRLPAALVDELRARDGRWPGPEAAIGAPVRFLDGPFGDRIGRIAALGDADRVRVLFEILGSEREVVVPGHRLTAALL
jgi:transcriptional antiterminator RfaH